MSTQVLWAYLDKKVSHCTLWLKSWWFILLKDNVEAVLGAFVISHISEAISTNASPPKKWMNTSDRKKHDPSFLCNQ